MLNGDEPQPITQRLARAVMLDLLAATRYTALVDGGGQYDDRMMRIVDMGEATIAIICRRGVSGPMLAATAAEAVRWVAGRVMQPAEDRTWDAASAVGLLEQLRLSVEWGRKPTPIMDKPQHPTLNKHHANIQHTLVRLAQLKDHGERYTAAEMWLEGRGWDAQSDVLDLMYSAGQALWALMSFNHDPTGLLNALTFEMLQLELDDDLAQLESQ